jgi:hypothetical protein
VTISFMVLLLWFLIESILLMSAIRLVIVNIMPAGSMRLNKARPLCDLIKLNTILAQEYVAGKASTGTHVSSDLLNTGRFYMALYPPTGILTSRLRGYLSSTTSRGHLGTTYMVSTKDKYRDI